MEFKVGDRVKINRSQPAYSTEGKRLDGTDDIGTVREISPNTNIRVKWDSYNPANTYAYMPSQLIKENNSNGGSMNILTFAKLSKEQRALNKAGIIDDQGNLTPDGQKLVMEQLAQSEGVQKYLIALAKEYNKKPE